MSPVEPRRVREYDIVVLQSGGPLMLAVRITQHYERERFICCVWLGSRGFVSSWFPEPTLRPPTDHELHG